MSTIAIDAVSELRAISVAVCEEAFQPPPVLTVSEWADENVRLSAATSARPGRFRTDAVPYIRRIQDVLCDETVREVTFAKSAQVAGSTAGMNYLGYVIDLDPSAFLYVWPTEKALKTWSTKRLDPFIEMTDVIAAKMPQSKRRDKGNTIASKAYPGGYLQLLTAKSTTDLRQHSARRAVAEEIDEWEGDIGGQGDPLELLRARFRTFWNGKLFKVSTPTLKGLSRIWDELEASSYEEWFMPCPHCNHMQILRWRDGDEDLEAGGSYRIVWEKDAEGEPIPGTCCYICEDCGALIEERWKEWMLERGEWRARFPHRTTHIGFHINSLSSPLCPWDEIVSAFRRAVKTRGGMTAFVNTFLGLPYEEKGAQIDKHVLSSRAVPYAAPVPHGVGVLTAGVDVQGDRLELLVWGWGAEERSWVIAWEQIHGDPGQPAVWLTLEKTLFQPWIHESGAPVYISAAAVDAGYQTEHVHRFCDRHASRNVFAVVGRSGRGIPIVRPPAKHKHIKRTKKERRPTHVVGIDACKDALAAQLRVDDAELPGYVTFNEELDDVFYDQLTSEKLVSRWRRGRGVREWELIPGRHNEVLDMANYARGALSYLIIIRKVLKLAQLGEYAEKLTAYVPGSTPTLPAKRGRRVRSRGIQ